MAGRPVFHRELGLFFRQLRESRRWSQRQAADKAEDQGLTRLDKNSIARLEAGKQKALDIGLLLEVSALYRQDFDAVLQRTIASFMRDQTCHASVKYSPGPARTGEVTDAARIDPSRLLELQELRLRVEEYAAAFQQVSIAWELITSALESARVEVSQPAKEAAGRLRSRPANR